jgi:hypothetical protein
MWQYSWGCNVGRKIKKLRKKPRETREQPYLIHSAPQLPRVLIFGRAPLGRLTPFEVGELADWADRWLIHETRDCYSWLNTSETFQVSLYRALDHLHDNLFDIYDHPRVMYLVVHN